ncbi:MAG: prolipoprotein diacylglyceryl transferase [Bryobacterales bacterium]|nr:prolipoprotein diacylglyceryl transferase [Bryobacterales bacterium]
MFPKLISFGDNFFLPTYGLLVAAGFLVALWITGRLARQRGLDPEKVSNVAIYGALAGLAGAKLLMFVFDFDYFYQNPREAFSLATLQSGGVFFGGLVIAVLAGALLMRRYGLPVWGTFDVVAPGLAIGQALGRLGCFAAGCCWGVKCDRAWAVRFTNFDANKITGVPLDVDLHPTQLYEAGLLALAFVITWRLATSGSRPPGFVFGAYLLLAAAERFIVEFFREHQQANFGGGPLSNAQLIALGLAVAGAYLVLRPRVSPPA